MEKSFKLVFRDVYGGDGAERFEEVEEQKLSRKRSTSRTRSDIGVTTESAMDELRTEKSKKSIATFRRDDAGQIIMRLGGVHGKLWGTLKDARGQLFNALGDARFKSPQIMNTIQIQPVWVALTPMAESRVEQLPQILNAGFRSTMIVQRFDVLPKASCQVTLLFPDNLEEHVDRLLQQVQMMGCLNKRRATMESFTLCL